MEKLQLTAKGFLNSELDLEEFDHCIDEAFDQYKKDLKKRLTDLALKQTDEHMVQPFNAVMEAFIKLVDKEREV